LKKTFFHLIEVNMIRHSSQSQRNPPLVRLEVNKIYIFYQMLEMLNFEKGLIGQIALTKAGMKISVEKDKSMLSTAYFQSSLFDVWEPGRQIMEADTIETLFISLTEFMQCLSIFSSPDAHLTMTINSTTAPIELLLEDNGVVTKCDIAPVEHENLVEIKVSKCQCRISCYYGKETPYFWDVCSELEIFSNVKSKVTIAVEPQADDDPDKGVFSMGVKNEDDGSYLRADFPNNGDIFPVFDVPQSLTYNYQFDLLRPALRAWQKTKKRTSLMMDEYGRMCIQHIVQDDQGGKHYVNFKVMPMSDI